MYSKKLKEFVDEIKYKNRNPQDNSVLKLLMEINDNPFVNISEGTIFYRCRIIPNDYINIGKEKKFEGLSQKDSFVPPKEKTKDLRASYRFIPYLYVASTEEIAIREVRASSRDCVNVAEIIVNENLTLFDLTHVKDKKMKRNPKDNLMIDLAELYSKPVEETDNPFDYIPTQYIAEYIKNLDYDGIKYPSSRVRENGYNVVIFNYEKCEAIRSYIRNID